MIVDRLEYLEKYQSVLPRMAEAIRFFNEKKEGFVSPGTFVDENALPDRAVHVNVSRYETKAEGEIVAEAHRRYADVQILLDGEEIIYVPSTLPPCRKEYDENTEAAFYAPVNAEKAVKIHLPAGSFAVFFPGEPHAPGRAVGSAPTEVTKAVIKILVD